MAAPLRGVRVLDLTNVIAGPLATYLLALMGAEVIKIEVPGVGDLARKMGTDRELGQKRMGLSFLAINAGKKSITLNLKSAKGKRLFLDMVKRADVVVENYRPGTMARLGLDYVVLKAENPKLIYCCISGFGREGPMADRPSYDQIIQGLCGLMRLTGPIDGEPSRAGYVVCDSSAAVTAAFGIAAALAGRERNGEGEMIDVSMLDTALSEMAGWNISNYVNGGSTSERTGNHSISASPSGTFRTGDGLINIVVNEQAQFERMCQALNMRELLQDARFAEPRERFANRLEMCVVLERRLAEGTTAHWEKVLTAANVPAGPLLTMEEAVRHPQVEARQLLKRFDDVPGVGRPISVTRLGFQLSDGPVEVTLPPPQLGGHTEEMLREMGYDAREIEALRAEGVV